MTGRWNGADPVLLFDGDCGFCSWSISKLEQHGLLGHPAVSWRSLPRAELPVPAERLSTEVVLIRPGTAPVGGADALAATVLASRSPVRFAGVLMRGPLARAVYRQVARHRYRLPGGSDACAVR